MNFLSSVLLIDKLYIAFNHKKYKNIIKGMTQEVLFTTRAKLYRFTRILLNYEVSPPIHFNKSILIKYI